MNKLLVLGLNNDTKDISIPYDDLSFMLASSSTIQVK